jgi:hypothetical protein
MNGFERIGFSGRGGPGRSAAAWVVMALLGGVAAGCSAADDSGPGTCDNTRCNAACMGAGTGNGYCQSGECFCTGGGDADADADADGDGGDGCDERARWIYVVTSEKQMIRFYPDELRLEPVGMVDCLPGNPLRTPFSMAVDRTATAWVLYGSGLAGGGGDLFRVSTVDASCTPTTFARAQEGFELFGMGFASNSAGSTDETLFVAGGAELSIGTGSSTLGRIDMGSLVLSPLGSLPGWPELTGTGAGELWGFFPDTSPPTVQRIDKTSGAVDHTYDLPIDTTGTLAWAFAYWNGDFWIFLKAGADASSNIWKLESDDGSVTEAVHATGSSIVGAGVSTCAPYIII